MGIDSAILSVILLLSLLMVMGCSGGRTIILEKRTTTTANGTGAANLLAVWSSNTTLTSSRIYTNGTHVGIFDNTPDAMLDVNVETPGVEGLVVQGIAGQTADLFDVRSNVPDIYFKVNATGGVFYGAGEVCSTTNGLCGASGADGTGGWTNTSTTTSTTLNITATGGVYNFTGKDYDDDYEGNYTLFHIGEDEGIIYLGEANIYGGTSGIWLNTPAGSSIGLDDNTLRIANNAVNYFAGVSGFIIYSSTYFSLRNMSGSVVQYIDMLTGKTSIGDDSTPDAKLDVNTRSATDILLIVQGATAQSADLTEWQNSSAQVIMGVMPSLYTGGNTGAALCIDANNKICRCGSCA